MVETEMRSSNVTPWIAVVAFLAVMVGGCVQQRTIGELPAPRSRDDMAALVRDFKAFERQIGFRETDNFRAFSDETHDFPFCGYVSRFYLPYSYEDPAIHWADSVTEEECRALAKDADVYFGASEAVGESATPITLSMLKAPLDRLLYVVIHEDCHDQFDFPHGIEEALCNMISQEAMMAFSEGPSRFTRGEYAAIRHYAQGEDRRSRTARTFYERLSGVYARYHAGRIMQEEVLRERTRIFRDAEHALDWEAGTMNNVALANAMTYSRHYVFFETVFQSLGRDLARTVAFFKCVDEAKPRTQEVLKKHRLRTDRGVKFIRTYEAAIIQDIEQALAREFRSASTALAACRT